MGGSTSANSLSLTVGVIGLGFMDSAIAGHLVREEFTVLGCDIDRDRVDPLVAKGGLVASSPEEIADAGGSRAEDVEGRL